MDSKKLPYTTLAEMAQDELFRRYLDMDKYLTVSEYTIKKDELEKMRGELRVPSLATPKLRVVEGQVLLIKSDQVPSNTSPMDYALGQWYVPSEFQLTPIPDGMLRGVLLISSNDPLTVLYPNNRTVNLTQENMPTHMHHSAVTTGSDFVSLGKATGKSYAKKGNYTYDMFHSDSLDTGLDKNELDGTVDEFEVEETGEETVAHNNIPPYTAFYGFVVQRK